MKKVFISQPMKARAREEILKERREATEFLKNNLGDDIEVMETLFDDFAQDRMPLHHLARSLAYLADADIACFVGDWSKARGCKIEHQCAKEYGIKIVFASTDQQEATNE